MLRCVNLKWNYALRELIANINEELKRMVTNVTDKLTCFLLLIIPDETQEHSSTLSLCTAPHPSYLLKLLPNWVTYIKVTILIWKTCVTFLSVPSHSTDKHSSFIHALRYCIISVSQEWNFRGRERDSVIKYVLKRKFRFLSWIKCFLWCVQVLWKWFFVLCWLETLLFRIFVYQCANLLWLVYTFLTGTRNLLAFR